MVDPLRITSYTRTNDELEEFILNAIAFAGKNAVRQSRKMHTLFYGGISTAYVSPFEMIRDWKRRRILMKRLRCVRIGKYSLLARAFDALAHSKIDLRTCSVTELESFHGIGPKTARFFILHSRPKQEVAVLDTHMLKEMKRLGFSVPKGTPQGGRYAELERAYIAHIKKRGITDFAAYDLTTWKKYSRAK